MTDVASKVAPEIAGDLAGPRKRTALGALALALAPLLVAAGCASRDQATVYSTYSRAMQESGRFRTESAPADAPFGLADIARNFERVAFVPEDQLERFYRDRRSDRRLSKWDRSPRYTLLGDGVRPADHAAVAAIAAQLSQASGLTLREAGADGAPDITIFVVGGEARSALAALQSSEQWYAESIVRDWIETPNPPCFAILETATPEGGLIDRAAIFLKAELDDPLRQACFVEELTQSLGPIFDHPDVRPSIFNDDQEFIALTRHDEALLRLLYAPGLRAGMRRPEAAAAVAAILAEQGASLLAPIAAGAGPL